MLRKIVLFFNLIIPVIVFAQPANDNCSSATPLNNISSCSKPGEYTNAGATESGLGPSSSWTSSSTGSDVWFTFIAEQYDVTITVTGNSPSTSGGTLQSPLIALYTTTDCISFRDMIGSLSSSSNVASLYKGALSIGQTYYIRVSAENNNTGTFKFCINNQAPILKPGQDNASASLLCSKESFTQTALSGVGGNNHETAGTCLGTESNSVWYKWTAANNGTLTFTITPTVTNNDIDWVLYDLGSSDNPGTINAANAIRCAAGHGVDNRGWPSEQIYYLTGLNLTSIDSSEASGGGQGQNGFVKYVDMIQGHVYALLVDNFTSADNGFTMDFGGTGQFLGPQAALTMQENQPCTATQSYTFTSQSTGYSRLVWRFGAGASLDSSTVANPPTITYSTPGIKTVILEVYNDKGCYVLASQTFEVGVKPARPSIQANKPKFCLGDTIILSTPPLPDITYRWTGPNNFTSDQASVSIPVNSTNVGGTYTLVATQGNCVSDPATINIPPVLNSPVAAFTYTENQPCTPAQNYTFTSQATGYSRIVWRFGSGASLDSATVPNPPPIRYSASGMKTVVLEAYNSNGCLVIASQSFTIGQRPAAPSIQVNKPQFCLRDTILLSTSPMPNTTYSWTGPNNFSSNQANVIIPVNSTNLGGIYKLIAIQGTCVSDTATVIVPPVLNNPVAAFRTVPILPAKLSAPVTVRFFNQSTNANSYLWDFGDSTTSTDTDPVHVYTAPGEYDVTLTAFQSNVCENSVTKGTFVINADNTLFVPNTFTPNGDNINDEFVVNISNIQNYRIDIFNRWGQHLFAATNIFDNWTGLYNGQPMPVGTYYYVINAVDLNGLPIKKSGFITILR